jgi:hypothetical protein
MTKTAIRITAAMMAFLFFLPGAQAQDNNKPAEKNKAAIEKQSPKPYKILHSGKRVTLQSKSSSNSFKRILVWTASGNRIVEHHDLDATSFTFYTTATDKIFFLMLELQNGKRYTDKFGIQ